MDHLVVFQQQQSKGKKFQLIVFPQETKRGYFAKIYLVDFIILYTNIITSLFLIGNPYVSLDI
jgi:hypothetical protein